VDRLVTLTDAVIVGVDDTGEILGLNVRWGGSGGAAQAPHKAAAAITMGWADCTSLVYGNDERSAGRAYGGPDASCGDQFPSYAYFAPWRFNLRRGCIS
jgi:hypothetical protein